MALMRITINAFFQYEYRQHLCFVKITTYFKFRLCNNSKLINIQNVAMYVWNITKALIRFSNINLKRHLFFSYLLVIETRRSEFF